MVFAATMGVTLMPPSGRVECKLYPAVPPARAEPRLAVLG